MLIPFPGLPFRLMLAGIGSPDPDNPANWKATRTDYILTGPAGFRSWLRLRVWSVRHA